MSLTSVLMGWRLFLRRNPRLLVIPFVFLLVLGLVDSFFGRSPQPDHVRYGRYLYQESYLQYSINSQEYNISVIADRDKGSRLDPNYSWESFLKNGVLTRDFSGFKLRWHPKDISLVSKINEEGRGMELSELAYYNGHLYTCDDRTGIVYEVFQGKSIPHYILTDGDGNSPKGFKCEWMAVKDDVLYVGGLGKEWTNDKGEVLGRAPQWIKTIDLEGRVKHISWVHVYEALRKATGTSYPGYLIHEAVRFHPVLRRWFFLPRRVSTETYDDKLDESRGSNTIISTNEDFGDIRVNHIGEKIATHGFSSFAFIPYHEHEIVALKTEEAGETIATYMMVFNLDGTVLLPEVKIADMKFEGIEIV